MGNTLKNLLKELNQLKSIAEENEQLKIEINELKGHIRCGNSKIETNSANHAVIDKCQNCGKRGANFPYNNECGNCLNTNKLIYYDHETIELLLGVR